MRMKDFSVLFFLHSLIADSALFLFRDTKTGSNLKAFMYMNVCGVMKFLALRFKITYVVSQKGNRTTLEHKS